MVTQEYVSTTLPMMANTMMQMVSIVINYLLGDDPDDATQLQKVTLPKFIVRDDSSAVISQYIITTIIIIIVILFSQKSVNM